MQNYKKNRCTKPIPPLYFHMRQYKVAELLLANLDHTPTGDQKETVDAISEFVAEKRSRSLFILAGYAGTGKTSLISALVKGLAALRLKSVLLAPTGRAAKVLAHFAASKSYTIHKKIYRQKSAREGVGTFVLDRNLHKDTLFIVDEASMIGSDRSDGSNFGSGNLLSDLLEYVYSGAGCKLLLAGDTAQLPPVGSRLSPALDTYGISLSGYNVVSRELRDVVRQSELSGILVNATALRSTIDSGVWSTPELIAEGFDDIERISGEDLTDSLNDAYNSKGVEDTVVVVNSNRLANVYNNGIRRTIFFRDEEVSAGDLLMVVKNNYFWLDESGGEDGAAFIANGDVAEVQRVKKCEERYGLRFAEMSLWFPDYQAGVDAWVVLDTLNSDSPSLPSEKVRELYHSVAEDYSHIRSRRKQWEAIRNDPWFNALQVKFAYAVTCHKAQGGQWKRVFIDQGHFNRQEPASDYLRWLYTAVTRATEKLSLVNFSDKYFTG